MSKITSKLQVTIPKAIAEKHGLRPGSEFVFESGLHEIYIKFHGCGSRPRLSKEERVARLREMMQEQEERNRIYFESSGNVINDRGWTREDLYTRGVRVVDPFKE